MARSFFLVDIVQHMFSDQSTKKLLSNLRLIKYATQCGICRDKTKRQKREQEKNHIKL